MRKIHIMADSPCDLTAQETKEYGVEILPINVTFGGKTRREFLEIDRQDFWRVLNELEEIPTTAQFTPADYLERFKNAMDNGCTHVICIAISSTASGTFTSGVVARDMFYEEYGKGMTIEMVDSRSYSIIYGRMVIEAARLRNDGADFETILERLGELISRSEAMLTVFKLKHLKNSGRITGAAAFVGDAIGLRPILYIRDGLIDVRNKARGDRNALSAIVAEVEELIENPEEQEIIILHADVPEEMVALLEEIVLERLRPRAVSRALIGPCVAVNTGPNAIAVVYYGKKRI